MAPPRHQERLLLQHKAFQHLRRARYMQAPWGSCGVSVTDRFKVRTTPRGTYVARDHKGQGRDTAHSASGPPAAPETATDQWA